MGCNLPYNAVVIASVTGPEKKFSKAVTRDEQQ
jgi:hypothetical protein